MNRSVALWIPVSALHVLGGCRGEAAPPDASYQEVVGGVERLDPAIDALIPPDAQLEVLADGFAWTEGPVWRRSGEYLLFTDIPNNTIHKWSEANGLEVFLRPAGCIGENPPGRELGSNGLALDAEDRLIMADHGNRQIARLNESNYTKVTLANRYDGLRLNSPNDLAIHSNGDIYFTDPPYGLDGLYESPLKELDFAGVYRLQPSGELTLLTTELRFPNGIALSPDESTLYVSNTGRDRPIWMAYDLLSDGTLGEGYVLFDSSELAAEGRPGMPDGIAVDQQGNLFATGPGGVLVITPDGQHIGTIETGQPTANCTFGDDGSTLYITANDQLMRIALSTTGLGF
jgi:gluconolactonase